MNKDHITTLAGGTAGLTLLYEVNYAAMHYGEYVKLIVAFVLILTGYFFYHGKGPGAPTANV